jgi:hypothetical protein
VTGDVQSTAFRKDRSEKRWWRVTNRAPLFGRTVPKSGASDTSDVSAVAAVLPYMYVAIGSSDSGAKPPFSRDYVTGDEQSTAFRNDHFEK